MKSLYESILSSTKSGLKPFVWDKTKPVIDNILNANSEYPMEWFLEGNNLRLDNDTIKKIVNKLKKVLPEKALFGMNQYGVPQIAKQRVECWNTSKTTNPRFAYYCIEIGYAIRNGLSFDNRIRSRILIEKLIWLTEDNICALDIPETKSILNELDTHFDKYDIQNVVNLTSTYSLESKLGGKYRIYSFKDLKKEFIALKK